MNALFGSSKEMICCLILRLRRPMKAIAIAAIFFTQEIMEICTVLQECWENI
jgi:hypothetical protein